MDFVNDMSSSLSMRPVVRAALLGLLVTVLAWPARAPGADPELDLAEFLEANCTGCHGPRRQKGGIRLDGLKDFEPARTHLWTLVHGVLSKGEMPPEDRERPPADELRWVLTWIEREQLAGRPSSTRRLNRRELSAALADLTGLPVDHARGLPGDGLVDGFDTGASALRDSADSVDRFLAITRRVVESIRILEPSPAERFEVDFRGITDPKQARDTRRLLAPWNDRGARFKVRGGIELGRGYLIEPKWVGERGGLSIHVPPPPGNRGVLRIDLSVSSIHGDFEGLPAPRLWVKAGGEMLEFFEVPFEGGTLDRTYHVQMDDLAVSSKGLEISLMNRVEMPYAVEGFENDHKLKPDETIPGGPGLFRPAYDRKKLKNLLERPVPHVVLEKLAIEVDHVAPWPPEGRGPDRESLRDDPETARELLGLWITRAWRRPVSEIERKPFLDLYERLRREGKSLDEGLRAAFQAVLLSTPFRFLESPAEVPADRRARALASRLSFALHGTPPDAELLELAADDRLLQPEVLASQVDRLLADPRSKGFLEPFTRQWLELDQPITIVMRHLKRQDFRFGRYLKESLREETLRYVATLFRENRPASELVSSDWTLMNDSTARHYGYPDIRGGEFRRVALREDDTRGGGILAHAGIQSMLTWMGDNWVIYRGAWTLRKILDDPPPPPPLEVPELDPSEGENRGKSFRELLKQHQEDPRCSVCHETMDPMGFAFQNFDPSGRWRKIEHEKYVRNELDGKIEWWGQGETRPVDTKGSLPRGEEFETFAECKDLMVRHYLPDIVRGVMKRLTLYLAGRKADVDDLACLETLIEARASEGYPLGTLLRDLVTSRIFLEPRTPEPGD